MLVTVLKGLMVTRSTIRLFEPGSVMAKTNLLLSTKFHCGTGNPVLRVNPTTFDAETNAGVAFGRKTESGNTARLVSMGKRNWLLLQLLAAMFVTVCMS